MKEHITIRNLSTRKEECYPVIKIAQFWNDNKHIDNWGNLKR
jgi:hypothetical protein